MDVREEVLALAQRYLQKIKRSGPDDIMAICPFHRKLDGSFERDPSFAMSLSKGLYFCHSCQEKGNLYTFLRNVLQLTREQIDMGYTRLIESAARNLPPQLDVRNPGIISYDPLPEALLGLFDYLPTALIEKGFTEETLKHFEIGFDKWHMRITYPLRDLHGQLVGISGRAVDDYGPRYKVYDTEYKVWELPTRMAWDKRVILWNAHEIYAEVIHNPDPPNIVVVEGFKACMWLQQAGISNVVALTGTYLSREQRLIFERIGSPIYLFLDNDEPGITGTVKTGQTLLTSLPVFVMNYPTRILELPEADKAQPDWLTPEEVLKSKTAAVNFVQWMAA